MLAMKAFLPLEPLYQPSHLPFLMTSVCVWITIIIIEKKDK
jgi:hypothetical protein